MRHCRLFTTPRPCWQKQRIFCVGEHLSYNFVTIDDVIDVSDWWLDEERPTGSRPKVTVLRPADGGQFIFKEPKDGRTDQIWSELTASFIGGDLLDWPIQKVSIGSRNGRYGNLLHYIYAPPQRMIEGWQLCREADPDYDEQHGKRHTLELLEAVLAQVALPVWKVDEDDFRTYWARALAFDCFISNSDRHAENWAFIASEEGCAMAPLYDNGTSLGCQLERQGLQRCFDAQGSLVPEKVQRFIERGCHHIRMGAPAARGGKFGDVCAAWLRTYPDARIAYEQVADLDVRPVLDFLHRCHERFLDLGEYALTVQRLQHMYAILQQGQERIRNALQER
mgnify:CR=1 FL=1